MVQKKAFAIILRRDYHNYESARSTLNQDRLDCRRERLSLNFAAKYAKSPKHSFMFPLNKNIRGNMRHTKKYEESQCKTNRYYKSAIPFMRRLLNKNSSN